MLYSDLTNSANVIQVQLECLDSTEAVELQTDDDLEAYDVLIDQQPGLPHPACVSSRVSIKDFIDYRV